VPDEPHFPAPGEKIVDPYREPETPAPAEPSHKIVMRAEPPPSSRPKRSALTREEMSAMIAVTAAQRPQWKKSLWRMPVLVLVSVASHVLHASFGTWTYAFDVAFGIASLVWVARPLFKRDGFS
jgi:hypothetical protein